jgi:hypothetical protein
VYKAPQDDIHHPLKRNRSIAQSEWNGDPLHQTAKCMKRCLMDVIFTNSNLREAKR